MAVNPFTGRTITAGTTGYEYQVDPLGFQLDPETGGRRMYDVGGQRVPHRITPEGDIFLGAERYGYVDPQGVTVAGQRPTPMPTAPKAEPRFSYNAPVSMADLIGQVQSPLDITQDPGYQFRFDEGLRALDASASARGLQGSGRVARELSRYGQGLASQEYGAAHQRRLQDVGAQAGLVGQDFGQALQQAQMRTGQQAQEFGQMQGLAQLQEALRQGQFGRDVTQQQLGEQLTQGQFGRGLSLTQQEEALREGRFRRQMGLADLGFRGATSFLGGTAPTIPGYSAPGAPTAVGIPSPYTVPTGPTTSFGTLMGGAAGNVAGVGQARGIGQAGAGQAWQGALSNIGQLYGQGSFGNIGNLFGGGGQAPMSTANMYSIGGTGFAGY